MATRAVAVEEGDVGGEEGGSVKDRVKAIASCFEETRVDIGAVAHLLFLGSGRGETTSWCAVISHIQNPETHPSSNNIAKERDHVTIDKEELPLEGAGGPRFKCYMRSSSQLVVPLSQGVRRW